MNFKLPFKIKLLPLNIKTAVFGIAAVAALVMLAGAAFASDTKTAAEATFKIYDGDRGMCSATFYRNDPAGALFITAAHCVDGGNFNLREQKVVIGATDYEVLSERVYPLKVVKTVSRKDVALFQLKDKDITFSVKGVDFATPEETANMPIGTPIMVVGYPAGQELTVSLGEFTATTPGIGVLNIDGPLLRFTATAIGGNSGGGVYAKLDGEWKYVGTMNAIYNPSVGAGLINYGTTPATIEQLLTGFKVSASGQPVIGLKSAGSIDER